METLSQSGGAGEIEEGEFEWPEGISVAPDGSVYVVDTGNDRIQKFDSYGNFITKWGGSSTEDGEY